MQLGNPEADRHAPRSDRLSIFFATYSLGSAVCHYRLALQAEALRGAGHLCNVGSGLVATSDGVIGVMPDGSIMRGINIIVLQPMLGADLADVLNSANRKGQSVVMDLDDWFWDAPSSPTVGGELRSSDFREWCDRARRIIGESHLVTASTPYIVEQISSWQNAPPVRLVRNAIDLERWGRAECVTDGPVLGYAGSVYNHLADVRLLRGWLGPLLERHDLRMIHVGAHPSLPSFADLTDVDPARMEVRNGKQWSEYAPSHPIAGMDIGIVPLMDRPFNQAKSALKGMEYAACGVPFVASSSPEYVWFGSGALVGTSFGDQSPDKWIEAIERLLDPATRATQAQHQSERLAHEDIALRWTDWEEIYLELVETRLR